MGNIWQVDDSLNPFPCPFKPGQMARIFAVKSTRTQKVQTRQDAIAETREIYEKFLPLGFYATPLTVYANACDHCNACIPVRINVRDFRLSGTQTALLRRNADLTVSISEAEATIEHFLLFRKYVRGRHPGGTQHNMFLNDFVRDLSLHSHLMEIRNADGALVGATAFDRLDSGLNGYTLYYDPDFSTPRRSLGTFLYLKIIAHAQAIGVPHIYIGGWIQGNNKLGYKEKFDLEAFDGENWTPLNPATHTGGPTDLRKFIPIIPVP